MRLLFLFLLFFSTTVTAEEVYVCYNYNCAVQDKISLSSAQLLQVKKLFAHLPDAQTERNVISQAIGLFESFAGAQTPTFQDKGGNENDDGVDGRMDCIDHSTNTTTYLHLMEINGFLKFHRVLPPVKRAPWLVNTHWAALIEELDNQHKFIVDSWFFDNGQPAAIFDLNDWMKGATPNV